MKSTLKKSAYREIRSTKSRFLSIFGIVAIGVGFFSGVKAAAPDMRLTADAYFDRAKLMDFRLVSTYGFDEKDLAALREVPGAEVVPSYYTDVLAKTDEGSPSAARVISLNPDSGVNTLTLVEGRLPEAKNECVTAGSAMKNPIPVGTVVTFTDGEGAEPSDLLEENVYTVVGIASSPMFIDKTGYGSTTVGNGALSAIFYVPEENFCVEYHTEVYLRFPELAALSCYDSTYEDRTAELTDQLELLADQREADRFDEILSEANEELDKAKRELADAEAEANEEIADGERELSDAGKKLDDAAKELADGEQKVADGERELADAERKVADGEREIADGERELADARAEIDQGYADLAQSRQEYEDRIAEAERELADAAAEIAENEKKLSDGKKEYAEGLSSYEEGLAEYEDGKKQYEDGKKQYEDGQKAYNDALSEYSAQKEALNAARLEYEAGEAQYAENAAKLAESKAQLDAALSQLEQLKAAMGEDSPYYLAAKEEYNRNYAQYAAAEQQLAAAKAQLSAVKAQLDGGEELLRAGWTELALAQGELSEARETLEETEKQLSQAEKELSEASDELVRAKKELDDGEAQLADGKKQYEDGVSELEQSKSDAERQFADAEKELADAEKEYAEGLQKLADARRELADGRKELEDGRRELEDARRELADGRADYEQGLVDYADGEKELSDGKTEAEEKISDAKRELADAEKEIAELEPPEWYVFDRGDSVGYAEYGENADRINNIASVFPVFFILVAALVCLTTMTRMVDEQRVQIGTLKALGYSNGKIIYKYMLYAAAATASGAVFGVLAGMKLFPFVIISAYGMMYSIPELKMPIDLMTAAASIAVSLAAITGTVFFACRSTLSEQAAQLMRPKAPKTGKRILLERVGVIWKRLHFSGKVTARNLFRYKRKMFMSVVGIAGCTALLMTGFALFDSINDIILKQYSELQSYDGIAVYDSEKYPGSDEAAADILAEHGASVGVFQKQMDVTAGGKTVSAYVAVPREAERFTDFLNLRDRKTGVRYQLTDGAVYMDEKLTLLIDARAGDSVDIFKSDTERVTVTLSGAFENYPGHYVYMTENTYRELFGEMPEYNALYFTHGLSEADEDALAERLLTQDGVLAVTFSSTVKSTYQSMLDTLGYVILVIIASAGALAYIVMYNLTNINIEERIREIATLKVLGFYDKEVDAYIFRENIMLTLIGTAVGLVLGVFLANYVITTAEVDFVMFGRTIYPTSYVLAALFTLVFSLLVTFVMHRRLKNVNMIEALKSVE